MGLTKSKSAQDVARMGSWEGALAAAGHSLGFWLREVSDVGPKSILDALKIPWKYIEHTSNTLIDE